MSKKRHQPECLKIKGSRDRRNQPPIDPLSSDNISVSTSQQKHAFCYASSSHIKCTRLEEEGNRRQNVDTSARANGPAAATLGAEHNSDPRVGLKRSAHLERWSCDNITTWGSTWGEGSTPREVQCSPPKIAIIFWSQKTHLPDRRRLRISCIARSHYWSR